MSTAAATAVIRSAEAVRIERIEHFETGARYGDYQPETARDCIEFLRTLRFWRMRAGMVVANYPTRLASLGYIAAEILDAAAVRTPGTDTDAAEIITGHDNATFIW